MLKISVLVSGGGTNLQALIDAQNNGILKSGKIVQVISSRSDSYALERAKKFGICADVAEIGENFESKILEHLKKFNPEIIVLAGFMHILSKNFIEQCNAKIINIHPSLIPSFCGKGFYGLKVHEAVLKSGVKITGATVHFVNEVPDGGEIIAQKAVPVLPDDTPERLQRRVMENAEWIILPRAVESVCRKINSIFPYPIKYPGRGIITGCTPSGKIMLAYFIMGRSQSSKARIFERSGDDLIIKLTKQDKNFDPSLILYSPLRMLNGNLILTNGDQTDTIYDFVKDGETFEEALRTREYEPDPPHFTPRISAMINKSGYKQSILKKAGKYFFEYEFENGKGHLIHTYDHDVTPDKNLPSFSGEPREIKISEDVEEFSNSLWNELDKNYRVSLYVRFYDSDFKSYRDKLFNTNAN
ncbi:MAG: phosphoribosylglycinamide formyltransferase [Synergistaceae bacterium]|nr:phosphoribosylglycinamide formyltransferase [Synergistaceae bacterium]MBR0252830.1 phosphoribosylglycinamide formyltransferase [Synergistaceae bacterium]